MSCTYTHAVYIGRFQPMHTGHLDGIRVALEKADNVIILIGSSDHPRTPRNPFTKEEREKMITSILQSEFGDEILSRIHIQYIRDRYNSNLWIQDVQSCVEDVLYCDVIEEPKNFYNLNVCLVGHKKADTEYLDSFPQWKYLEVPQVTEIDSTRIRNAFYSTRNPVFNTYVGQNLPEMAIKLLSEWREANPTIYEYLCKEFQHYQKEKQEWEDTPYPVIFTTVDSVMIRSGHVLMVRRKFHPGKGLLALPGGFLNPRELTLDGALREQKEEASIDLKVLGLKHRSELKRFVVGRDFYEHPDRSERGRSITFAYMFDLGEGKLPTIKAGDDAASACWVPLSEIKNRLHEIFDDHASIIEDMTNRFGKRF